MPRVAHLNCHNNPKALAAALSQRAQFVGLNEVGKIHARVKAARGHQAFFIPGVRLPQRTSWSTAILVREELRTLGGLGMMAADWSVPTKIAPERWLYAACAMVEGKRMAHVEFHNHAVVDGRRVSVDRVKEHEQGIEAFRDTLLYLKRMGFAVSAAGDLNSRDAAESQDWQDVGEMLRSIDFEYKDVGIDWVVHDPDTLNRTGLEVIDKDDSHSDHRGLVADYKYV